MVDSEESTVAIGFVASAGLAVAEIATDGGAKVVRSLPGGGSVKSSVENNFVGDEGFAVRAAGGPACGRWLLWSRSSNFEYAG